MAPSPNASNLEELLVDAIVASDCNSKKHNLMQLSICTYMEKTKGAKRLEVEYPLRYTDSYQLYFKEGGGRANPRKKNKLKPATWRVDAAVVYQEDGRNICELIEVETKNLSKYKRRLSNIRKKAKTVEKTYLNRALNADVFRNADEVRFSLVMGADRLEEIERERLAGEFKKEFGAPFLEGGVVAYNLYLCKNDVCALYPTDPEHLGSRHNPARKRALASAYASMRGNGREESEKLYKTVSLA